MLIVAVMEKRRLVGQDMESYKCKQKPKSRSSELLAVGSRPGIHEKLLLKPKHCHQSGTLETVKIPRSDLLNRVQSFLPQIAHANEELKRQLETTPAVQFDIENLGDNTERFVEMDVSLVELSDSDGSSSEGSISEEDLHSDEEISGEVTADNFRLPPTHVVKGKIELLESTVE
ncbi:NOP protein chaperone 1 [Protopterus annectens]|uniref:NOP protein chaperone 1 n=1 Tax=Protopterus annectens TaxID=7888 RepID=UPI001CF99DB0|nr:NOP protein chaperone 1 [Protopterus annectens]